MRGNVVADKSFAFAVRIVRLNRFLCEEKREYVLSKQLLRSGTSVGANVREAQHAQGKRDFASKMNIALKEANETLYWIELLHATDHIDENQKTSIWNDANELVSLLVAIVKTTKASIDHASNQK